MTVTFEVALPPEGCSPNSSKTHWAAKRDAKEQYGNSTTIMVKKAFPAGVPKFSKCTVSTVWYCARKPFKDWLYRPTDSDNANASLKAMVDALVKAGFVPDDSHQYLTLLPPTLLRKKKEHGGESKILVTLQGDLA